MADRRPPRSKDQHFRVNARRRVNNALRSLELLKRNANPRTNDFTQEQVDAMVAALEDRVAEVKTTFQRVLDAQVRRSAGELEFDFTAGGEPETGARVGGGRPTEGGI